MKYVTKCQLRSLIVIGLLFSAYCASYAKTTRNSKILMDPTERFSYCGEDGFAEIDIDYIKRVIASEYGSGSSETSVYVSTSDGYILRVTSPEINPETEEICTLGGRSLRDIAVDEDGIIYVTSSRELYRLDDPESCSFSVVNVGGIEYDRVNALSFDTNGNLYYGADDISRVYRYDADDLTNAYIWHDFGQGSSAGDFVMLNGKMYIAWNVNGTVRLYEVTVDDDINYVSHVELGIIDNQTFGLASERGQLYSVTPGSINRFTSLIPPLVEVAVTNTSEEQYGSWFGAAGLHEAQNITVSIFETSADRDANLNALPDTWTNTESGGQPLYVLISLENGDTIEVTFDEVEIVVNETPFSGTAPNPISLCTSSDAINLFNQLGGTPNYQGSWTDPNNNPFGNVNEAILNPESALSGDYKYTVIGCNTEASTIVQVSIGGSLNVGEDATVDACNTSESFNLFDVLAGTPDAGGVWEDPNGAIFGSDHLGTIDPGAAGALSGPYTYSFSNETCANSVMATITLSIITAPANIARDVSICDGVADIRLWNQISDIAQPGGQWIAPDGTHFSNNDQGSFDPDVNPPGDYIYTEMDDCGFQVTLSVAINAQANAGINTNVTLCSNDAAITLLTELGGTPDTGGEWIDPNGISFGDNDQGVLNPSTAVSGDYTYTVTTNTCPEAASSTVSVIVATTPEIVIETIEITADTNFYEISYMANGSWNYSLNPDVGLIDEMNSRISQIPIDTNVEILAVNPANSNCSFAVSINAPDQECPLVNPPTNPTNLSLCSIVTMPQLSVEVNSMEGETANWYNENGELLIANSVTFTPSENDVILGENRYLVEAVSASRLCTSELITLSLSLEELPDITLVTDGDLCTDSQGTVVANSNVIIDSTLSTDSYNLQWFFNDELISEAAAVTINRTGNYRLVYGNILNEDCTQASTITISGSLIPESLDLRLSSGNFANNNDLIATVNGGSGDFEYSLDGGNYQTSNTFADISLGSHYVTAVDTSGCGNELESSIYVMGFPNFFTPNGDAINDTWNIILDPTETNMEVSIFVYDRFGKLLSQVFPESTGWDGTFAGKNLPADDYWFFAKIKSTGETFTSHFSLIR